MGREVDGAAPFDPVCLPRPAAEHDFDLALPPEAKLTVGTERELERLRLEAKILRENLLEEAAACRLFERIQAIG